MSNTNKPAPVPTTTTTTTTKRPYTRPTLIEIGSVRDLTMKSGSRNDMAMPGATRPGR